MEKDFFQKGVFLFLSLLFFLRKKIYFFYFPY